MSHLAILVGLVASFFTLAAALHAGWLHREFKTEATRAFAMFMGLIYAADTAELITHYLSANAGLGGTTFKLLASLAIAAPTLLAVLVLVRLSESILGKAFPLVPFIVVGLAIAQLTAVWTVDSGWGTSAQAGHIVQLSQLLLLGVFLWLAANLILVPGKGEGLADRPAAWLGIWVAARPTLEVPIFALTAWGQIPYDVSVFVLAIVESLSALAVLGGARQVTVRLLADKSGTPFRDHFSGHLEGTGLTPREREVAELVARGLANKEAARRLNVSPVTIRDHLSNIYRKTGLRNRVELTNFIKR